MGTYRQIGAADALPTCSIGQVPIPVVNPADPTNIKWACQDLCPPGQKAVQDGASPTGFRCVSGDAQPQPSSSEKKTASWVLPAAIGVGVIALGYLLLMPKKTQS